jgi:lysophospholipase L1-like esterase
MRKRLFPVIVIGICVGLPLLGGWAGYWLAYRHLTKDLPDVRDQVSINRQNETLAGAYLLANWSLEGVDKCYYEPPDFTQITWVGKDMPTPFVGYAPVPGRQGSAQINSLQFRYARELETPKPAGVCRIFLLGGSTAFGSGASSNDTTIGGYLEKYLNERSDQYGWRFEVITAASSGWATTNERILIENRLVELEPDVVLEVSGHNDAFWGLNRHNTQWFRGFQDLYFMALLNAVLKYKFDAAFPKELGGEREPGISVPRMCGRLRRNIELAHAALEPVGADYCFALQPITSCSKKRLTGREQRMASRPGNFPMPVDQAEFADCFAQFRSTLAEVKRPQRPHYHFFDLTPIFDDCDAATDIFIDRCHFGDRGHDLIARRLRDLLDPILKDRQQRGSK